MPSELLNRGQQALAAQAFSTLLNVRLQALVPGEAELQMPVSGDLLQQHGFVHGGALAYLADNALTFAGGSVLGDCVTSEFKINYLKPAVGSGTLIAAATVAGSGRSQAVCRCDLFLASATHRTLVAVAQGTIRKVERERA